MKKRDFIAGIILLGLVSQINAQSLKLYDFSNKEKAYKNGDTIELWVSAYDNKMENILVAPKNIGANAITVNVKQTVLNRIEGNEYSFCWGSCYEDNFEPTMYGDPDMAVNINSNSFCEEICIFDFTAKNPGITYVRYTFFDMSNNNDSACIILKYNDEKVAVPALNKETVQLNSYPNPCNDKVRIEWGNEAYNGMHIRICNILGVCIFEQTVSGNSLNLSVSDWPSGIYFYTLYDNNQAIGTKKMTIKH